jgi:hypothetical protein
MNQKSRRIICREYCWSRIIADDHSPDIGHGTSSTMPMRNKEDVDDDDDDDDDWKSKAMGMRRPLLLLTMLQRRLVMWRPQQRMMI